MGVFYEQKTESITAAVQIILSRMIHLHKELEIVHVYEGKAVAYADKNSYLLTEGDTFITFPNQVHYYESTTPGKFELIIFSAELITGYSKLLYTTVPESNVVSATENPELVQVFQKIKTANGEYRKLLISGYTGVIMGELLPHLKLKTVGTESDSTFHRIVSYCANHFNEELTLDSLSEELHLSKYYVSRLINLKLNQNFNEYINNMRVGEACNLLRESNKKIAEISGNVGFGTIRSFNRAFKQIMGCSPAEYREKISELKKSI